MEGFIKTKLILARKKIRILSKSKFALIGGIVVLLIVLTAAFAPLLAPYDPYEPHYDDILQSPCSKFLLGTDYMGRDILSRVIYGSRPSLKIGFATVCIASLLGVPAGLFSAYFGSVTDTLIMRSMDALLAFPPLLLVLLLIAILGPSENNTVVAIGIVYVPKVARLIRSKVLSEKNMAYVEAARAIGRHSMGIMFLHLLPNCMSIMIVQVTVTMPETILVAAALGFLGIGTAPNTPVWGLMISKGRNFMELAPWTVVFPALALSSLILGLNFFGDGVRDVVDVRGTMSRGGSKRNSHG